MKKVKYLMGAAGVAPAALGLLAQGPPADAAVHTAKPVSTAGQSAKWGKTVRVHPGQTVYMHPDTGCGGVTPHQRTIHFTSLQYVTIGFWSAINGDKICIGTIWVHASGYLSVYASVHGKDGQDYCHHSPVHPPLQYVCRESFYRPFSVVGYGVSTGGSAVSVPYTIG